MCLWTVGSWFGLCLHCAIRIGQGKCLISVFSHLKSVVYVLWRVGWLVVGSWFGLCLHCAIRIVQGKYLVSVKWWMQVTVRSEKLCYISSISSGSTWNVRQHADVIVRNSRRMQMFQTWSARETKRWSTLQVGKYHVTSLPCQASDTILCIGRLPSMCVSVLYLICDAFTPSAREGGIYLQGQITLVCPNLVEGHRVRKQL
jgi:hypothetical protein